MAQWGHGCAPPPRDGRRPRRHQRHLHPYVLTSTCTAEVEPVTHERRRAWFAARDLSRHPVTVLEVGDEVVGWGALSPYHARWGYRFTVENSVYVRADQHRRGFGALLLADLVLRARTLGYRTVVAAITSEQEGSVVLHARFGFVEVGRLPGVIEKFDRPLGLLLMQLAL